MVDRFVEDILGSHPGDVGAHSCLMVSRLAAQITSELRNKRPVHFYQVAYFDRREVRIHWAERPPGRLPLSARKFRRPPE